MAYDLNRCPQTEAEAQDYIFTLYNRTIGQPANDWQGVMQNSNLPHNIYTPGLKADGTWPMFGFTQMWSNGPRGRIFLPSQSADENNYYTRQIQVIEDAPEGGLRWAWKYISGFAYSPVQGVSEVPPGTGPPPAVIIGGGLTEAQVQAMIDDSIAQAIAGFQGVLYGDKIALRTNSGLLAGIQGGGPTVEDQPVNLIGKNDPPHAWESFEVVKGE